MHRPVALNLSGNAHVNTHTANTAETDNPGTNHPSNNRKLPLIPKQPPPRPVKKLDLSKLPDVGTWIKVTTRRDTYTGRVVFAENGRLRIKEGAGFWDVQTGEIVTLDFPPDPKTRASAASSRAAEVTLIED